ncbi:MAG: CoB--CoM heterodisulfide reductase iron-sulfur subunit B family protein, partial [Caldisericia bacterium]|nr:CoB--CoM heterodisulfide reductase iron-sulfur subunit B family protein [Caldisericia bacterium]
YPGCSEKSTAPELDATTLALIDFLHLDIKELKDWVCCGASSMHSVDKVLHTALSVMTLDAANAEERDIMVQCPACLAHVLEAKEVLSKDSELKSDVLEAVGKQVDANMKIRHFSSILHDEYGLDKIREKVTNPLQSLSIASYYGCLIVRPPERMQYDDPENPMVMDQLMSTCGAEIVQWPFKTKCCGAGTAISDTDVSLDLTYEILRMAKNNGAECICVLCPLCQNNLDLRQKKIEQRYGEKLNLPVLYYTQLLGLAFGLDPIMLQLNRLFVDPFPLLKRKGIL